MLLASRLAKALHNQKDSFHALLCMGSVGQGRTGACWLQCPGTHQAVDAHLYIVRAEVGLSIRGGAVCRYEILELKVIHRRRRTGFEETKDFPIRVDDLIAGRYQACASRSLQLLFESSPSSNVSCGWLLEGP